jgi:hypothetical protein
MGHIAHHCCCNRQPSVWGSCYTVRHTVTSHLDQQTDGLLNAVFEVFAVTA